MSSFAEHQKEKTMSEYLNESHFSIEEQRLGA